MVGYATDNRSIQVQFLVPGPNKEAWSNGISRDC